MYIRTHMNVCVYICILGKMSMLYVKKQVVEEYV